jgi:hypothetical protein
VRARASERASERATAGGGFGGSPPDNTETPPASAAEGATFSALVFLSVRLDSTWLDWARLALTRSAPLRSRSPRSAPARLAPLARGTGRAATELTPLWFRRRRYTDWIGGTMDHYMQVGGKQGYIDLKKGKGFVQRKLE